MRGSTGKGFRDPARAMAIYEARKRDKRTFVDIGQEYGITGNRVRAIYRKLDFELNGYNADHHRRKEKRYEDCVRSDC